MPRNGKFQMMIAEFKGKVDADLQNIMQLLEKQGDHLEVLNQEHGETRDKIAGLEGKVIEIKAILKYQNKLIWVIVSALFANITATMLKYL